MWRSGILLAAVLLTGCPAVHSYHLGESAEVSGQSWRAAGHYLDALDRRYGYDKAKLALLQVNDAAWEQVIAQAQDREHHEDFTGALDWYTQARRFVHRLEQHGALDMALSVDLDDKIEEMRSAVAYEAYAVADQMQRRGQYADAIEQFNEALRVAPDFKDTAERIAQTRYLWAQHEVESAQYRSAAGRFETAVYADNGTNRYYEDAIDQASAIYAALGRHYLEADACRQATRDLRAAARQHPADVADDLAAAIACATKTVAVMPIQGRTNMSGVVAEAFMEAEVRRRLPGALSEFVVLMDASAARRGTKEEGVDFAVTIALTEAWVTGPELTVQPQTFVGRRLRACGETEIAPCYESLTVTYDLHRSTLRGRVGAQARVVDAHTGVVVQEIPRGGPSDAWIQWATDFRGPAGIPVPIATSPTLAAVEAPAGIFALRDATRTQEPPAALGRRLLSDTATQLVTGIRDAVDVGPALTDPARLSIPMLGDGAK